MKFSITDYNYWELQYFLRKINLLPSSHIGTQIYGLISWGKGMIEKVKKLENEVISLRKELEKCGKSQ